MIIIERDKALEEAAQVCEKEADLIDMRFPDEHGGRWAKLVGRRALLGAAALIRQLKNSPQGA